MSVSLVFFFLYKMIKVSLYIVCSLFAIVLFVYLLNNPTNINMDIFLKLINLKNPYVDIEQSISNLYKQYSDLKIDDTLKKYEENEKIYNLNYKNLLESYNSLKTQLDNINSLSNLIPDKISIAIIVVSLIFFTCWYLLYKFEEKIKNSWLGRKLFNYTVPINPQTDLIATFEKSANSLLNSSWKPLKFDLFETNMAMELSLPKIKTVKKEQLEEFINKRQKNILLQNMLELVSAKLIYGAFQMHHIITKKTEIMRLSLGLKKNTLSTESINSKFVDYTDKIIDELEELEKISIDFLKLPNLMKDFWDNYKKKINQSVNQEIKFDEIELILEKYDDDYEDEDNDSDSETVRYDNEEIDMIQSIIPRH